jgi:hypothetical protein
MRAENRNLFLTKSRQHEYISTRRNTVMATFCGLAAVLAVCVIIGMRFGPSYGDYNCCSGRALQSLEEEEARKKAGLDDFDRPEDDEYYL